jgi:hypothetical protein
LISDNVDAVYVGNGVAGVLVDIKLNGHIGPLLIHREYRNDIPLRSFIARDPLTWEIVARFEGEQEPLNSSNPETAEYLTRILDKFLTNTGGR